MVISHHHQFIFIKCRKTAGTSVQLALRGICGNRDVISPVLGPDEEVAQKMGLPGPQHHRWPWYRRNHSSPNPTHRKALKGIRFYNHMSARVWHGYFKFCVERNPWDKVVSHYFWTGGPQRYGSVAKYLLAERSRRLRGFDMCAIEGQVVVDQVYRYETLPAALAALMERLNLKVALEFPAHRAKGNTERRGQHYREVLGSEEREVIRQRFSRELAFLGYEW